MVIIGNIDTDGTCNNQPYYTFVQERSLGLTTDTEVYYEDAYFVRSRPQYPESPVDSVISVKDYGALGNGINDDTSAIVAALATATVDNLIYFPAGSYIVTSTITIPPNTRMTGQVWSQFVASGSYFADMANPQPMIRVGNVGDVGTVEMSDFLFTSIGSLPGLIMVEWNVQAESQGSVGMWDCHFRVGGASNGYFENMWAWVADHDIDNADDTQITVACARGILIESQGPTWLYGTASEHSILYQYNFANSLNTFAGMIQTESPYYQYTSATQSPGPFNSSLGLFANDTIFPDPTCNATALLCDFSWALLMQGVENLTIAGAGFYSWYDNNVETCLETQNCQQRLVNDQGNNTGLYLWNLVTIGAVEMISDTYTGDVVLAAENTQGLTIPWWSTLAGYLSDEEAAILSCLDNDTRSDCYSTFDCNLNLTFATMADIQAASSSFLDQCTDYYALNTLYTILTGSMANYTIDDQGYSAVFGDYVSYEKEMIPLVLQEFMAASTPSAIDGGPGNKYFDCTCEGYGPTSTQRCPFRYTQLLGASSFTMTYTLINETGFYDDLQKNYAINKTWVQFGDTGGPECAGRVETDIRYVNIPQASDDITIANPQDTISGALPQIAALESTSRGVIASVNLGWWNGSNDDLLQIYSMPVFMIQQAVNAMAEVKEIGDNAAKADKIKLILEILGVVFIFLPFADEFTSELDAFDGIFGGLATIGNVGLAIEGIIADPESAPIDILGLLVGGGGDDEAEIATMATARREMTEEDIQDIGDDFQDADDEMQNVIKLSCKS